jgi:hypothetical protein
VVVLGAADVHAAQVVREQRLERLEPGRTADVDLAEMAEIEQADALADGAVLRQRPRVLDRHEPSAERGELGPERPVDVLEGAVAQVRIRHLPVSYVRAAPRAFGKDDDGTAVACPLDVRRL